jgi:aquaporin Z
MSPDAIRKLLAEAFGSFVLVFIGTGAIVSDDRFGGDVTHVGVALVFGLIVMALIYALGDISGCHLNPAVTVGLVVAGRHPKSEAIPYIIAQVLGGLAGAGVLYLIASGKSGFDASAGFASNGFGDLSPGKYSMVAALVAEIVLTFFFLLIILGATDKRAPQGFAPIAIGLGLTLIHLIGIPVTNLSVNPARSTAPALFAGGAFISQLWLFWLAPIAGAALAGIVYPFISGGKDKA